MKGSYPVAERYREPGSVVLNLHTFDWKYKALAQQEIVSGNLCNFRLGVRELFASMQGPTGMGKTTIPTPGFRSVNQYQGHSVYVQYFRRDFREKVEFAFIS